MPQFSIYKHGVRTDAKVAITFDDGPNPPQTEQVLSILARANVRATFFLLGKWVDRFPRTVERIIAAGHLVGNHGYSGQGRLGDYDAAEAVIAHIAGQPCRYLRPHTLNYGAYFQSAIAHLPERRVIAVEIDSGDWKTTPANAPLFTSDEIVGRVLNNPALGSGSIILFHDGAESEDASIRILRPQPMIAALPRIIEAINAIGLIPVRLDEMELDEPIEWQ